MRKLTTAVTLVMLRQYLCYRVFKMLERIMYNRLQKYLKDQNILDDNQFEFQTGHSTYYATAQLVDQIYEAFDKSKYIL